MSESSQLGQPPDLEEREFATLLFDGVCNLCNGWVDFVIRRDPMGRIRFAALQSPEGSAALENVGLSGDYLDSIILVESDGRVRSASTGVLETLRKLRWPWPLLYLLIIVPPPIRDYVYRLIANRRYRWFGKRNTCRVPTDREKKRFL